MTRRAALRCGGKLVFAYIFLLLVCTCWGSAYVRLLLPMYQREVQWLAPQYRLRSLSIATVRGESAVKLSVATARGVRVGRGWLPPGVAISSATLRGHIYQHLIVMATLLLTWPARRHRDYAGRLLVALPLLLVIEWLDVPLVLLGSIADLLAAQTHHARVPASLAVSWMNFLNGGGRLALSAAAALLALAIHRVLGARAGALRAAQRTPAVGGVLRAGRLR